MAVPLPPGAYVRFDYTLRVDGKVIETSSAEEAMREKMHRPGRHYAPMGFFLGSGAIIQGLDEEIAQNVMLDEPHVGPRQASIPPEKAYGERLVERIVTKPTSVFGKSAGDLKPGLSVTLEGRTGIVTRLGGGRVTVDTNHHLAGKTLEYEYRIVSVATDPKGKAAGLLLDSLGPEVRFNWEEQSNADGPLTVLRIDVPTQVHRNPDWAQGRLRVVGLLRHAMTPDRVRVVFAEAFDPPATIVKDVKLNQQVSEILEEGRERVQAASTP